MTSRIKVIHNVCYGWFGWSEEARNLYIQLTKEKTGEDINPSIGSVKRHDPILIEVFERLGNRAAGKYSDIKISVIPYELKHCYRIYDYDGIKSIILETDKWLVNHYRGLDVSAMSESTMRAMLTKIVNLSNVL